MTVLNPFPCKLVADVSEIDTYLLGCTLSWSVPLETGRRRLMNEVPTCNENKMLDPPLCTDWVHIVR